MYLLNAVQRLAQIFLKRNFKKHNSIAYTIFHVENELCSERHKIKENLESVISTRWSVLNSKTFYFEKLQDAQQYAAEQNLHFNAPPVNPFLKGEIGLWISTISALKQFLSSDFDILIVFEDDVQSTSKDISTVDHYLRKSRINFDIFALYTKEAEYVRYGRKRHVWSFIVKNFLNDNPKKVTRMYQDSCCAAYAYSRKGARKLLKSVEREIRDPIDWHIFRGKFKGKSFKPSGPKPFSMVKTQSTIQIGGLYED